MIFCLGRRLQIIKCEMRIAKLEATLPHYTIKQYINALGEELMN
jgi:hypothetical protein